MNVTATQAEDIQFRFRRSPWLIEGRTPAEVIRENIRLASAAMKTRLGIDPAGFRTPGGFATGLTDRPDMQQMLLDLGFTLGQQPVSAARRWASRCRSRPPRCSTRSWPRRPRPSRSSIPAAWSKCR